MLRLSKAAREKATRYLRSYKNLADLFVNSTGAGTWRIQFCVWDYEADHIVQHQWCFPKGTPRARVLSVRDTIVQALEGNFRTLGPDYNFPEHCAGIIKSPGDLARLRWEVQRQLAKLNDADLANHPSVI